MTDRLEELIWMEFDGELSAGEARELAELRSRAAEDGPEGALESEIRELGAELAHVDDVAPPPDLKHRVLAAIEPSRPPATEPLRFRKPDGGSDARRTAGAGAWGTWRRWGYLAAGLVLAGVAIFQLMPGRPAPEDSSHLAGTLAAVPEPGEAPGLDAVPGSGMPDFIRLARSGGRLLVTLAPGAGESVFVCRAPGLEVEQVELEGGARGTWETVAGQVTLRVVGPGQVEARLLLAQPDSPFRISASGGGFAPFDQELFLDQLSER